MITVRKVKMLPSSAQSTSQTRSGEDAVRMPYRHLQELIRTGYPDRPGECWPWPGAKIPDGYGRVKFNGRTRYAHRVAYELHVGPIPDRLMLDHICHERDCFNPSHLQPVTHAENLQNRAGLDARNTSGHRNVYWDKQKSRWRVKVRLDGVLHHGGYFHSLEDAAAAAERLRKELGFRDTAQRQPDTTLDKETQ